MTRRFWSWFARFACRKARIRLPQSKNHEAFLRTVYVLESDACQFIKDFTARTSETRYCGLATSGIVVDDHPEGEPWWACDAHGAEQEAKGRDLIWYRGTKNQVRCVEGPVDL